ncbi:MAG: hypothetical protein QGF09_04005 [Rhodospirillales bacterium]|jgi:uncharacterized protein|nr:hypothetical protein [Rhodospirillales bacterium]
MFSLPKLILLAVIVGAIWYGYKFLGRRGGAKLDDGAPDTASVDTNKCAQCGDYVSAEAPSNCGKSGCPYG